MMWDQVLKRLVATVEQDVVLSGIYGTAMRLAGTGKTFEPAAAPILEWTIIGDTESELWSPVIIQFDQWALTLGVVTTSERRLRTLFHQDLPTEYGGVIMWAQYEEGSVLASPDRNGFAGRAIRFRFTPLRERYAGLTD